METKLGSWMDEFGACKVCGGEIPYGHANYCDIFKMELEIKSLRNHLPEREGYVSVPWRPIETAPKDETDILLYFPSDDAWDLHMRAGWWFVDGWYDCESASHRMTDFYGEPTHWMPLPEAPK